MLPKDRTRLLNLSGSWIPGLDTWGDLENILHILKPYANIRSEFAGGIFSLRPFMEKNPTKKQIAQIWKNNFINLEKSWTRHRNFQENTPSDTDSTFGISFRCVYLHICTSYIVWYIYILTKVLSGYFSSGFLIQASSTTCCQRGPRPKFHSMKGCRNLLGGKICLDWTHVWWYPPMSGFDYDSCEVGSDLSFGRGPLQASK